MSDVDIKALVFDVFGTVVDWRTSIAQEASILLGKKGFDLDWLKFAELWRAKYQPAIRVMVKKHGIKCRLCLTPSIHQTGTS